MIWKFDHAEYLSWEAYNFYMTHALPAGWYIMSAPMCKVVKR